MPLRYSRVLLVFVSCAGCSLATPIASPTTPAAPNSAAKISAPRASCPVPEDLQIEVEAAARVNLDEEGRPRPTRLRIYQLSDLGTLSRASYEDLWQQPQQALAASALSNVELTVYPGQALVQHLKRDPKADFIAALAVFREPQGDAWRTTQALPLPGDPCQTLGMTGPKLDKLRVRVFLDGNHVESLHNYAGLPLRNCASGGCGGADDSDSALRGNERLRTFEEDAREPELGE
jgi:type VI secretion system protein VasD